MVLEVTDLPDEYHLIIIGHAMHDPCANTANIGKAGNECTQ